MQEIMSSDLEEADWMLSQGNRHFHDKRYADAIHCYDLALELFPQFPMAFNNRARSCFMLQQYERARDDYRCAISLDPLNGLYRLNHGILLNAMHAYEQAIEEFTVCIEKLSFVEPTVFMNRGYAYACTGHVSLALDDNRRVLSVDPHNLHALNNMAHCYDELGETEKAIELFSHMIDIDPHCEQAYDARGRLFYSIGLLDRAIVDYTRAMQVSDSVKGTALRHRAEVLRVKGLHVLALRDYSVMLEESVETKPLEEETVVGEEMVDITGQRASFRREIHARNTCHLLC